LERFIEQRQLPQLGRNLSRSVSYERATRSSESLINSASVNPKIHNELRHFINAIEKLI
jgi:hypothetical protein